MARNKESVLASWSAPECRFTAAYLPRVLDDIRLAVIDAFFSLPRGGAEIGGILLGDFRKGEVRITGYAAIECEHAFGPSFTLSSRDQARLAEILAETRRSSPGRPAVGWYHSHTRSEIFLSDADQEIHRRFFPEAWQAALVLRPHTFQPTRAGFFFREEDGSIRGDASYREFDLDPLPPRPNGAVAEPASPPRAPAPRRESTRPKPASAAAAGLRPPASVEKPPPASPPAAAPRKPRPAASRGAAPASPTPQPQPPPEPFPAIAPKPFETRSRAPRRWRNVWLAIIACVVIGLMAYLDAALRSEVVRLRSDLRVQTERTRKAEKDLADARTAPPEKGAPAGDTHK